jgi:hypothetical protein
MTATSTCTRCASPVRRRLAAIGVLLGRLALLALVVVGLVSMYILLVLCVLLDVAGRREVTVFRAHRRAVGDATRETFRSFNRSWKGGLA